MSDSLDLDAYFARIGYDGPREPTLAVLSALHQRHPYSIPFENLDPLLKRPVKLDLASLQAKLVGAKRGGYCFEQNGLLSAVLKALGFQVTDLGARVQWMAATDRVTARSHMLLKVETEEGARLADVGFGGMVMTAPLRFATDEAQDTGHGRFRLVERGEGELQLQAELPTGWSPMYQFPLTPQHPIDYEVSSWYIATNPASPFTSNLMAAWVTPDRRYGVTNNQVSVHHRGGPTEKLTLSPKELEALMHETFGLGRPPDEAGLAGLYKQVGEG